MCPAWSWIVYKTDEQTKQTPEIKLGLSYIMNLIWIYDFFMNLIWFLYESYTRIFYAAKFGSKQTTETKQILSDSLLPKLKTKKRQNRQHRQNRQPALKSKLKTYNLVFWYYMKLLRNLKFNVKCLDKKLDFKFKLFCLILGGCTFLIPIQFNA